MPRPLRILLADNDPAVRAVVATQLTRLGHAVEAVGGGRALVAQFRAETAFDLVVCDVEMPAGDGLAAAEAIRRAGDTPIILMAGSWTAEALDRAAAVGAHCLQKPFDTATLATAVAGAVPNQAG
jgi:CheY-like chemotaxis protein